MITWKHRPLAGSTPLPWEDRRYGCCAFPLDGEGGVILSCCLPVKGELPYCIRHCSVVYTQSASVKTAPYRSRTDAA